MIYDGLFTSAIVHTDLLQSGVSETIFQAFEIGRAQIPLVDTAILGAKPVANPIYRYD